LSIEIIPPETKLKPKPVKSEEKKKNTKVQERQEALDKARAWALERTRNKKKKWLRKKIIRMQVIHKMQTEHRRRSS
jgi:hypothetical protein